jgi:hypothetical protein
MKVHGICHCEAIAWEGEVDPARVTICHCGDCQRFSGGAFRASVPSKAEDFAILRGEPVRYVKTAESGNRRVQAFCGACGTPLYSADAEGPKSFMLRIGPLAERAQLPPQRQIWCDAALPWAEELLDVPRAAKQS